jgi:hypothetical protein
MFLTLMLVGYATTKFKESKTERNAELGANAEPAPEQDDTAWALGADAWVTLPTGAGMSPR